MNSFSWKQQRKQFLIVGVIVLLFAAVIIPTGLNMWHTYQQALANCAQNPATPTCGDLPSNLFQSTFDQLLFRFVPLSVLLLPLILGMFWGAPLLAREYSDGTNSLAWTQSVSRRKWLTVKLVWILVATALAMAAFAALTTWWSKTPNALNMNRFVPLFFDSQGIVPVAYGLFAVSLGIMVGAWSRKTMVAVGVTLGVFIALVIIVVPTFARPYYMPQTTVTTAMGPQYMSSAVPSGAWLNSLYILDNNGRISDRLDFSNMPAKCQTIIQQAQTSSGGGIRIKAGSGTGDAVDVCLNQAGYHQVFKFQPSSRYWDFQRIEAGIYLALAGLAIGVTYWLVLKRDA